LSAANNKSLNGATQVSTLDGQCPKAV